MHFAAYNNHLDILRELLEKFNCEADKRDRKVFEMGYILGLCIRIMHS